MTSTTDTDTAAATSLALRLVHEGWSQLQVQRPLAAWASWQRALRCVPDFPPARQALETLESAGELPVAARTPYKFRAPREAQRRTRWDDRFAGRDHELLEDAAAVFGTLAADDPADAAASFNQGLCLAWLGRNDAAIGALGRAVEHLAATDPEGAIEAWTLAEVLRQGAGAEHLADDLRYVWTIDGAEADAIARFGERVTLVPVPAPHDPISEQPCSGAAVFEWLDRPLGPGAAAHAPIPRLLATLVQSPGSLRFSSPDSESLAAIHDEVVKILERPIRREAIPLPLPLLDAAVWTFRLAPGTLPKTERELTRQAVESYFENRWIHVPRQGLAGLTPLAASFRAGADVAIRAKLLAVIRLREQLGARPRTARLYQGYPFDRLRRRLGLGPADPATVDPEDITCMSGAELDGLDPAALGDVRLAEAVESAAGLRYDPRTVRFADELALRPASASSTIHLTSLIAPLVRSALAAGTPEAALGWLDRAHQLGAARTDPALLRTFEVWRAEVHARSGAPEAALRTYEALLADTPEDTRLALDGAETLIDNGYEEHARPLLARAGAQARNEGASRGPR